MKTILKGSTAKRLFSDWSMEYWNMDASREHFHFDALQEKTINFEALSKDPQLCYTLFYAISKGKN